MKWIPRDYKRANHEGARDNFSPSRISSQKAIVARARVAQPVYYPWVK